MPRVLKCVGIIALLATLHQSTRFVDRVYKPMEMKWDGEEVVNSVQASLGRVGLIHQPGRILHILRFFPRGVCAG